MSRSDCYTVEEANRMIPWLVETIGRINELRHNIGVATGVRSRIDRRREDGGSSGLATESESVTNAITEGQQSLRRLVDEIIDRSIQIRDLEMGLVDFPGEQDGREIWLCFRLSDGEVGHWHERDRGFIHRKPL